MYDDVCGIYHLMNRSCATVLIVNDVADVLDEAVSVFVTLLCSSIIFSILADQLISCNDFVL